MAVKTVLSFTDCLSSSRNDNFGLSHLPLTVNRLLDASPFRTSPINREVQFRMDNYYFLTPRNSNDRSRLRHRLAATYF